MDGQTTTEKTPACNSGFAKWRVQCLFESLVINSKSVLLMKFSAENPPLRKAANRWHSFKTQHNEE